MKPMICRRIHWRKWEIHIKRGFFFNWMLCMWFFCDLLLNVRFKGIWNTVYSCSRDSTYFLPDLWVIYLHKLDISVKQILIKKLWIVCAERRVHFNKFRVSRFKRTTLRQSFLLICSWIFHKSSAKKENLVQ